jgi:hypothetical protein
MLKERIKKSITDFIDGYNKGNSRKWRLTLLCMLLATLGTFVPPLIDVWVFGSSEPLTIISGTEYVSLLTLVISAYFGANVWEKTIKGKVEEVVDDVTSPTETKEEV